MTYDHLKATEPEYLDDEPECGCSERAPRGEYWRCPDCDAEWFPEEGEEEGEDE